MRVAAGPPPAAWLDAAALARKSARLAAGKAGVYCRCANGRGPTVYIGCDPVRDREVYATTRIPAGTLLATGVVDRVVPLADAEVAGGAYGFPGEGGGVAVLRDADAAHFLGLINAPDADERANCELRHAQRPLRAGDVVRAWATKVIWPGQAALAPYRGRRFVAAVKARAQEAAAELRESQDARAARAAAPYARCELCRRNVRAKALGRHAVACGRNSRRL
jgi:hypothetical protein